MEHLVIYSAVYIYLQQRLNICGYEFLCTFSKRKLYKHRDAQTPTHTVYDIYPALYLSIVKELNYVFAVFMTS